MAIKAGGTKVAMKIAASGLPSDGEYTTHLETEAGSDTYSPLARIPVVKGKGKLAFSAQGTVPPEFGVETLTALEGRRVEIRKPGGDLALWLVIPPMQGATDIKRKLTLLPTPGSPAPDATAALGLAFKGSKGSSKLSLKVKKAPEGEPITLWIENDGGVLADLGRDAGNLKIDTKKGDPLPFGVATLAGLSGRAFEIRQGAETLFEGTIP
jgi:hypothetical protein